MSGRTLEERLAFYRKCAADGLSQTQTAKLVGIAASAVCRDAKRYNIGFPNMVRGQALTEQYQECADKGMNVRGIARKCNVTEAAVELANRKGKFSFPEDRVRDASPNPERFEVSGDIPGIGFRKHTIKAVDADAAQAKFAAAYSAGRIVVDVEPIGAVA